jgi:hypothetical protein
MLRRRGPAIVTAMWAEVDAEALPAERRARVLIDRQPADAGWVVHDRKDVNLFAGPGAAGREVVMKPGHARADYLYRLTAELSG